MKISIVTAVYNAESTVRDAIRSVASQNHTAIEHVVIDGASTDGTLRAIEETRHDQMVVVSEPDDGIYHALNKGIARATGDIVGFVHSDDFLARNTVLSRVAEAFSSLDVEAAFGDLDYVARTDTSRVIRHWSTGAFTPWRLRSGWMPAHPTLYLRRSVYDRLGGFDTGFRIAADYDFILRYFSAAEGTCMYIPEVLYKMRMGGASNRNLRQVLSKMHEDHRAIRRNGIGGLKTLAGKNVSKLSQFVPRR